MLRVWLFDHKSLGIYHSSLTQYPKMPMHIIKGNQIICVSVVKSRPQKKGRRIEKKDRFVFVLQGKYHP